MKRKKIKKLDLFDVACALNSSVEVAKKVNEIIDFLTQDTDEDFDFLTNYKL